MCDASHDLRLATSRAVEVGHHRTPDGHAVSQEIQHTSLFHFHSNEPEVVISQPIKVVIVADHGAD
jgi:hypothetical protein